MKLSNELRAFKMLRSILRPRHCLLLALLFLPSCSSSPAAKYQQPCMIDGRPTGEVKVDRCACL